MKLSGFPFCVTDWAQLERTEHEGDPGMSFWRTQNCGDIRVRIMEYAPGFRTGYWCSKGHVFYCLEGELEVELEDGRKFVLTPGLSFQVADDAERHRNYSRTGAKFFVVD
jgi:quercetin dioxygenase-like cupin family protein